MTDNLSQLKDKLHNLERQREIMVSKIHDLNMDLGEMKENIREIERVVADMKD